MSDLKSPIYLEKKMNILVEMYEFLTKNLFNFGEKKGSVLGQVIWSLICSQF